MGADRGWSGTSGHTDYAQDASATSSTSSCRPWDESAVGAKLGEVESTSGLGDLLAVAGTVVAVNDALPDSPEKINADPYGRVDLRVGVADPALSRRCWTPRTATDRRLKTMLARPAGRGIEPCCGVTVVAVFCSTAGSKPEGVNFCSSCGNALLLDGDDATITLHPADESGEPTDEDPITLVRDPHGAGVLVVTRGSNMGARYLLARSSPGPGHPESDIFLDDITVSAVTSRSRTSTGHVRHPDVGSLNGPTSTASA